jgi:hypothetical protein
VGYFSKEKNCQDHYNLACILTLPPFQKKGYGKFMISFAYQLSRLEGKPGTAERPLSDLGAVSFRSYWQRAVLDCLRDGQKGDVTIQEISEATMMTPQVARGAGRVAGPLLGVTKPASKRGGPFPRLRAGCRVFSTRHTTRSNRRPRAPRKASPHRHQAVTNSAPPKPTPNRPPHQDIMDTLKQLGLLQYWKGTHYINASPRLVEEYWRQVSQQRSLDVDPRHLHWQPLQAAKPK